MTGEMNSRDRSALIRLARERAKQAEREVDTRMAVCKHEVVDQMTAVFAADDALWKEAVVVAQEELEKANTHIRNQVAALGIPAGEAPQIVAHWYSRGPSYSSHDRRAELYKLADAKLAAMAKTAKSRIRDAALEIETALVLGGLESTEARTILESMPTVETLMPALSLDDLGVKRWQPPEDVATQLTTPLSASQRRRRAIRRVIESNPGASDRKIAEIAGCDHKTVAAVLRGEGGESAGELPSSWDGASLRERLVRRGEDDE